MRVADLDQVLAIEETAFAGDQPWTAGQFRDELDGVPDSRHYLVATNDGGAVVGYAGLLVGLDDADVQTLAVRPDWRRRGVGRALLRALLAEATARHMRSVLLEVRPDNTSAIALYRGEGFVEIARRPRYYADGADAVVLRRSLR